MLAARGISVTHETIWQQWPTPRETRPCRVAWGSARLNLIHPYHPRSCAGCFATELARPTNPLIGHSPLGIDGGDEAVHKASRPKSSSQVTLCWSKGDSNYQSHRERSGHGRARTNDGHHARSQLIRPPSLFGNTWDQEFESVFLQRRVECEPEFLDQLPSHLRRRCRRRRYRLKRRAG